MVSRNLRYRDTSKYDGTCRQCGRPTIAPEPIWWEQNRGLVCTSCKPPPETKKKVTAAAPVVSAQDQWSRTIRYHRLCVEREAAGEPTLLSTRANWCRVENANQLLDGTIEAVEAPAAAIGWANKGKLLFVGWPAVIVGKGNNPIVAPLLRSRAVVNTEDSSTPYMQLGGGVFELNLGVANEKH